MGDVDGWRRAPKVLLPTHAVMADGGVLTPSGGHVIALAARELSVPVVCVTGLYKLCPACVTRAVTRHSPRVTRLSNRHRLSSLELATRLSSRGRTKRAGGRVAGWSVMR